MSTRDRVFELVARVTRRDPSELRPEMTLHGELEIDSSRALELLFSLEESLGIEVPEATAAGFTTLGDVLDHCERASA